MIFLCIFFLQLFNHSFCASGTPHTHLEKVSQRMLLVKSVPKPSLPELIEERVARKKYHPEIDIDKLVQLIILADNLATTHNTFSHALLSEDRKFAKKFLAHFNAKPMSTDTMSPSAQAHTKGYRELKERYPQYVEKMRLLKEKTGLEQAHYELTEHLNDMYENTPGARKIVSSILRKHTIETVGDLLEHLTPTA